MLNKTIYIDKLAWIEVRDRKVLETRNFGKDTWYIPGGKRIEGETDEKALIREIREELSVDLIPETIEYYGTFEAPAHGKKEGVCVRMLCYTAEYKGTLKPGHEVEKMDWFLYEKKEMTSLVDHLIFDDLKKKDLID